MTKQERTTATVPGATAVIVQQGKILDYIDELAHTRGEAAKLLHVPFVAESGA